MPIIGRRRGDGYAEYPCVRRFRHRRLITLLWLQGFGTTAESMLSESDAMFSVLRLRQLVAGDQWHDALRYLSRFVPPPDTAKRPLSVQAMVLRLFLAVHRSLANIVAGGKENPHYSQYLSHDRTIRHGTVRLRSIILNILHCRHQVRFSIDWERMRLKAAEIVRGLAYRTPELKDLVLMPFGLMRPHNVLPIGFGFHRRHPLKKRARRQRAYALAKLYLGKTRSLPAISDPSQESCDELETESKALDWVADLVDECLKAGKRPESHQVGPLETCGMEGAPVAPVSQTMNLTSHAENFGATIAAPVSQTMARPAINPTMPPMAIGGKLATHVPTTGALFLGTMGAPLSQAVSTHSDNSGIALMGKAGAPVAPVSEMMNLTRHAGDSGPPLLPSRRRTSPGASQRSLSGGWRRVRLPLHVGLCGPHLSDVA